jgi:hypothetical protein
VLAVLLKALNKPGADMLFIACIITAIIYTVIGLYEIYHSVNIDKTEKIMWTVGFIFVGTITGILYLVNGRHRILRENQPQFKSSQQSS